MNGRSGEFDTQSMKQLQHRVIAWLGAGRQCFVKALATQARIFGELRHATRARHITHGGQEHVGIWVFQCSGYIFCNGFFIIEVIGSIESSKFGQGSLLIQNSRHLNGAFNVTLLRGFIAA